MSYDRYPDFSVLLGKTLKSVDQIAVDELIFTTVDDEVYKLYHQQDCCESVWIEDVVGDLEDLVGNPLLVAEEVSNADEPEKPEYCDDSYTWTFYKLATIKGYVDLRWFGTSNGYYSESVDFVRVK